MIALALNLIVSDLFDSSRLEKSDLFRRAASSHKRPNPLFVLACEPREFAEDTRLLQRANFGYQRPSDIYPLHHPCLLWIATAPHHRRALLHPASMLYSRES